MDKFVTYLKKNKKGMFKIWYKSNNKIFSNISIKTNNDKFGNWEVTSTDDSFIDLSLTTSENEKSLCRIELGETKLINYIYGDTYAQIYYLENNENEDFNLKIIESEDKFITIHRIDFPDNTEIYKFQKIMHFIK